MEAIPTILEEILKRKLAGKNDESLLDQLPSNIRPEDLENGEDSDWETGNLFVTRSYDSRLGIGKVNIYIAL